jgi:hypothetical protein
VFEPNLMVLSGGFKRAPLCGALDLFKSATFYNWRHKYGGLMPSGLKRIVANLSLDKEMLQDVIRRKI